MSNSTWAGGSFGIGSGAHSKKISRRLLMTRITAATVASGFVAPRSFLTARAASRAQETPIRGGTARLGAAGSPESFDPSNTIIMESIRVNDHLYSGLTWEDADLNIHPDLALSWEPNETATEWTFELRTGVKFHDGADFSADDVVATFDRILDDSAGVAANSLVGMIDSVEATAPDQVVFKLNSPYVEMPRLMSSYLMKILPKGKIDGLATAPIGTGPYKLVSHTPGERTVIQRFDDYWDLENEGFLDEIQFIAIPEETAKMAALLGGQVDVVNEVQPISLPMIENAPNIVIEEITSGSYQPIFMMADREPFNNPTLRQALKKVVDRDAFVTAVLQGHGTTAADQPVPPFDPMYGDIPIPAPDIEAAKALLAEAGYPDGIDLELHTSTGRIGMQESALTLKEQAAPAGFRITVQSHPIDNYWAEIWKNVPFFTSNWGGETADQIFAIDYVSTSNQTETFWKNEEFDELAVAARGELDEAKRREMYRRAQEIISEDGPAVIPYFRSYIAAWSDKLKGYPMYPQRTTDFRRAWLTQ